MKGLAIARLDAGIACDTSFSIAWGRNGSASETFRPYRSDNEAKQYRDDLAKVLRRAGHKVRCSTLRGQHREWWGWGVPCGITCTVYRVEIVERADADVLAAIA